MKPAVILLHGLRHTPLSMRRIERAFSKAGRSVHNIGYPSGRTTVEGLAGLVWTRIAARAGNDGPFDFVTHSLGSILLRAISRSRPGAVNRAVMLGPPNQGSELVDRLIRFPPARVVMGPAGQQLGVEADSVPNMLGPVDFCLGVIAGNRPDNPFSHFFIPGPEDGRVSVARTRVDGMAEQR